LKSSGFDLKPNQAFLAESRGETEPAGMSSFDFKEAIGSVIDKKATPIATGVVVPDKVETSIGTLNPNCEYPDDATTQEVSDNLNTSRTLQTVVRQDLTGRRDRVGEIECQMTRNPYEWTKDK
jgi:hypothetical protein